MAKVALAEFTEGPELFFSVSSGVGPNMSNQREDVLLVQYFIREVFSGNPAFKAKPLPSGPLKVDGIAGQKTFGAILHFQKVAKSLGASIATDGRVDPPIEGQALGSISRTFYTVVQLNGAFSVARRRDYPGVAKAADCPAELRLRLREPKFP